METNKDDGVAHCNMETRGCVTDSHAIGVRP